MKNLIIVVDAWETWPDEDDLYQPEIDEEANIFGYYINMMLKHIRKDPNNTVVHYTWRKDAKLMNSIDRHDEKIYYSLYDIGLEHPYPEYTKIYACGFHYGICIENALNFFNEKYMCPWRYKDLGIIENMTLRHPRENYCSAFSEFKHFYYCIPYVFFPLNFSYSS